jgi:hypothetical protein
VSAIIWPTEDERRALRLRVADHIEAHPEAHDQSTWGTGEPGCGTAQCVAGWMCSLGGGTRGLPVAVAALHLLAVGGMGPVDFGATVGRDEVLRQLRGGGATEIDCTNCSDCSRCTDCCDCTRCSRCTYCCDCWDCTDCTDCSDCSGVSGGVGLRGVHYPARAIEMGMRALSGVTP